MQKNFIVTKPRQPNALSWTRLNQRKTVEWRQLHLQAHPLYRQLQPRHMRRYPKSQVDNAPEDLKGAKGTNTMTKNQSSYHLNIYVCIIYILIIHYCVSKYEWIPHLLMAGAPKLKNPQIRTHGTLQREHPNSENLKSGSISVSGGSAQTLQQWRCIYERPCLRSYAVSKD